MVYGKKDKNYMSYINLMAISLLELIKTGQKQII